jgi:hypothetical protein
MSHLPLTLQAVTDYCYNIWTYSGHLTNRFCRYPYVSVFSTDVTFFLKRLSSLCLKTCLWVVSPWQLANKIRKDNQYLPFDNGVTSQNNWAFNDAAVRTSNLANLCLFETCILLLLFYLSCVRQERKHIRSDYFCVSLSFQPLNSGNYFYEI